jgi:hypothetical protein
MVNMTPIDTRGAADLNRQVVPATTPIVCRSSTSFSSAQSQNSPLHFSGAERNKKKQALGIRPKTGNLNLLPVFGLRSVFYVACLQIGQGARCYAFNLKEYQQAGGWGGIWCAAAAKVADSPLVTGSPGMG